ncbi:putative ATPase [Tamaricihabitans halophyticus]|uniref:Putative ATPase n=1 Tax=Tamaricihabitans halophyticus TaxID=1262583 RepID=A0A4R2QFJ9_9PSEU|nr:putative ATPase [Tamaricihabitans halophyticus]
MQGVDLPDSAALGAAVTRLETLRLAAMEDRFDAEISLGHGAKVVAELTDVVAAHPVRERLVAALMRALVATGRDSEALLVYERTRETLADQLGVDPSPELSALHLALLRGELAQRAETRKTNLRAELTSYVGKDDDVVAVRELLDNHRLTTLIGPGGAGKTRLATETARTMVGDLPDGVWLVELATIGPDDDVAQATLAAVRLRDALLGEASEADPTDRVIAAVRERAMVLILDNCEHVISSAAAFAYRALGECGRLRILATSREPLGITGEALWQVAPLVSPTADADSRTIESSPAVRLLLDRARAVRKDVVTDTGTLSTMARVCQWLDGIPLAIELAAARLRTMSLDQLADRLDDRFRLLTGGSRTALPRHRTLRAVVDWSWELLTDTERLVLCRLSVFTGGASLEAAQQVCTDTTTTAVDSSEVLELLTALTEKSLVVAESEGGPRYRMLGTIKEYAQQRLAEAGESELARRAHLAYFTDLAETAEPQLRRAEQVDWFLVLKREHDNITAAVRGAVAAGEAQAAMRLVAAAGWYWLLGGHRGEGTELTIAAASTSGEVTDEVRAAAYAHVAYFVTAGQASQYQAQEWIHQAYELSQRVQRKHPVLGFVAVLERMLREPTDFLPAFEPLLVDDDPWTRAQARLTRGRMRIMLGRDDSAADTDIETALAEFRALGERWGISFALAALADRLATRGEFDRACGHLQQAAETVTEVGATEDVLHIRVRQAQLHWLACDDESSAAAIAEAERCADRIVWPDALADLALSRAELARWQGDRDLAYQQLDRAKTAMADAESVIHAAMHDQLGYLTEDLDQVREHRVAAFRAVADSAHAPLIARILVGIADLALRREQYEQATRLLAASEGVLGMPDRSHPDMARIERTARSRLGDAGFAEAVREGAERSWSELAAVTLAS